MLRIIPHNTIAFTKSGNELIGNVEIMNIDGKPITYKVSQTKGLYNWTQIIQNTIKFRNSERFAIVKFFF